MVPQRVMHLVAGLSALVSVCLLAGCGASFSGSGATAVKATPSALTGTVRGGSQPISGSQVYLYAVSTSQDAGPASSLLVSPGYVTTGSDGSFSLAGDFTCPTGAYVYLLAKGGNPGLASGTNNGEIALASGLGLCSAITSSTHVSMNEVTTVATAYSLAAYASSETNIGANNAVPNTLGSAFANIPELVNVATGSALATNASGGIVPQATIDSLANALAACVSSDGTGTLCPSLMSAANVTGANGTPVDTFQAALNIAQNPTANVQAIFNLPPSGSPFQPNLSAKPNDWTITVQYPGTAVPPPVYSTSISPGSATIYQEGSQTYTVSVTGSTSMSGFSYQWTLANHAYGLLNEVNGAGQVNQASYCSTSAQSTYIPNASPAVTSNGGDIVQVSVFTGPGCAAANFIGSTAARVAVIPDASTTALPVFTTTPYSATVVLPTGSKLTPDQVSVITSVTSTTPLPSGSFTVQGYANGEQVAVVLSPAGNPMLMGWLDSNHPTVSASTTAEVLAYYALGGNLLLTDAERAEYIAQIPQQAGFPALSQAIAAEIAANPDAFAQTDPAVQSALNALFTSLTGIVPAEREGNAKAAGILVNPTGAQSGLTVLQTPPSSAYLSNAYRRRSHAFVTRVSETLAGTTTADPAAVTDFEIPPTSGVNGGVTGTVIDIFNAYYGNQPTEYAPISTDPFSVPLVGSNDKTNYQVLVVGPGGQNLGAVNTLTAAQETVRIQVSVGGFAEDALIPFLSNFALGSGILPDTTRLPSATVAEFQTNLAEDLTADFLSLVGTLPQLQSEIAAGNYRAAMGDLYTLGVNGSTFNGLFMDAVTKASTSLVANGFNPGAMSGALTKFNIIMNGAGGVLQIFDTGVYSAQLAGSDAVDTWTVSTTATKVTLTPMSTTLNGLGNVGLTVAVPGADVTGYSYQWTVTPAVAGNSLVGNLTEVGGAGRTGQTSYCSSSPNATYINSSSAVSNLTQATSDLVTVTVFSGSNCTATTAAPQVGSPVTATVTTDPTPGVAISPASATISVGGSQALTATVNNVQSTTGFSYQWTVTPVAPSTTVSGNLTGVGTPTGASTLTYCSASASATYNSTLTGALTSAVSDLVTVTAYSAASCPTASKVGAASTSTITTTSVVLGITPSNTVINPGGTGPTLTARLPSAVNTSGYSYMWTLAPDNGASLGGTLTDTGDTGRTGLTSYCSTSNQATYVSTTTSALTEELVDAITATAFSAAGCNPANQVALPATASVSTEPLNPGSVVLNGYFDWKDAAGDLCGTDTTTYICYNNSQGQAPYWSTNGYITNWALPSPAFGPVDPNEPSGSLDRAIGIATTPQGQAVQYLSQAFAVPSTASTLTLYISSQFGVGTGVVNLVANGVTTNLYTGIPPVYAQTQTCQYITVGPTTTPYDCVPAVPWNAIGATTIDVSEFQGQIVTLQLGGSLTPAAAAALPTGQSSDTIFYTGVAVQ